MSNEKINEIYTNVLAFAGCEVSASGNITKVVGEHRIPYQIDQKPVVMPNKQNLANAVNKIIFHPLREDTPRGESEVVKTLRQAINVRLNIIATTLAQNLVHLACSSGAQSNLNSEQLELVTSLGDVDNKTFEHLLKIVANATKQDPAKTFVNLWLRRGGSIGNKRYGRVCFVTFPIYAALMEDPPGDKVFGVKLRQRDRDVLIKLHQFMFPNIREQDGYSVGVNSTEAPFFDALMRGAKGLAEPLQYLVDTYRDFIEDADSLDSNFDWCEPLQDIDSLHTLIMRIPSQPGCEGSMPEQEVAAAPAPAPVQQVQQVQQPVMMSPVPMMPAPPPRTDGGVPTMSMSELLAKSATGVPAYPPVAMMPQQVMMPQMVPQMPQQQPALASWMLPQNQVYNPMMGPMAGQQVMIDQFGRPVQTMPTVFGQPMQGVQQPQYLQHQYAPGYRPPF